MLCHTCHAKKIRLSHLAMKTSSSTMAVVPRNFKRNMINYFRILKTHQVGEPGRELGLDGLLDLSPFTFKLSFDILGNHLHYHMN